MSLDRSSDADPAIRCLGEVEGAATTGTATGDGHRLRHDGIAVAIDRRRAGTAGEGQDAIGHRRRSRRVQGDADGNTLTLVGADPGTATRDRDGVMAVPGRLRSRRRDRRDRNRAVQAAKDRSACRRNYRVGRAAVLATAVVTATDREEVPAVVVVVGLGIAGPASLWSEQLWIDRAGQADHPTLL